MATVYGNPDLVRPVFFTIMPPHFFFFPPHMTYSPVRRMYLFSDTYGRSKNPFLQDDADALISTDFRSFPLEEVRREFDIYGREAITGHMLRLIFQLHEDVMEYAYTNKETKKEFTESQTGIFINAAPRVSRENGAPFYLVTAGNIRIVTTDLVCLASVKDKIETISRLDNDTNKIYSRTEQFRSSYTPFLLHPDHGHDMIEESLDIIPEYPDDKWELSYVDRFGNLITYTKNPEKQWKEIQECAKRGNGSLVNLLIGNVGQYVYVGSSLRDAEPGSLVVYPNGDLDVVRKWEADEDSYARLYKSAFFQFSKPLIGARIRPVD